MAIQSPKILPSLGTLILMITDYNIISSFTNVCYEITEPHPLFLFEFS